jgi:cell division protein FtsB
MHSQPAAVCGELELAAQTRQIAGMHDRAWIIPLGLLVITSVAVPLRLIDTQCIPRYLELRAQLERTAHGNTQLEREIAALKHETELLKNDARAIERLARDELGMVRQGEIVFQFPN